MGSGQWAVGSGQWAVANGQLPTPYSPLPTAHCLVPHLNARKSAAVKLVQPLGAEGGNLSVNCFGRAAEVGNLHPLADRRQGAQARQPTPKHLERTRPVGALDLQQRHPHL